MVAAAAVTGAVADAREVFDHRKESTWRSAKSHDIVPGPARPRPRRRHRHRPHHPGALPEMRHLRRARRARCSTTRAFAPDGAGRRIRSTTRAFARRACAACRTQLRLRLVARARAAGDRQGGFQAVIAESFAEIFFGNSTTLGLPCVALDRAHSMIWPREPSVVLQRSSRSTSRNAWSARTTASGQLVHPRGGASGARRGAMGPIGELLEGREQARTLAASLPLRASGAELRRLTRRRPHDCVALPAEQADRDRYGEELIENATRGVRQHVRRLTRLAIIAPLLCFARSARLPLPT